MAIIALDIGGTKIKGVLANSRGKILHSKKIFVQNLSKKEILHEINYIINFLKSISKTKLEAIGLSIPASVKNGKVIFSGTGMKNLIHTNIKEIFKRKFKVPVIVQNDANCFALAEAIEGKYSKKQSIVGFIWGTGIGTGIVINKKIVQGALGRAGEIGAIKLPLILDSNRKSFPLEKICGGKYIQQNYNENILPSKILSKKNAHKITKIVISSMSWTFATIINFLNPDVIIVGGGMANVSPQIYSKIKKETKKYLPPNIYNKTKIVKYTLTDDAGIKGILHLVQENLKD